MTTAVRTLANILFAAAAAVCFAGCSARVAEPTALDLLTEADRYVGDQIKGKIVQVRSDKSIGGLTPSVWYVVYYDPDATFKATEVKFGAGQKLEVTRPLRVIEMVTGPDNLLDKLKLKVDSNRAVKVAAAEPVLRPVKLTATQLRLQNQPEGPVWRVRLWAASLKNPNEMVDIGEVFVSAESGGTLRADLHIDRVN